MVVCYAESAGSASTNLSSSLLVTVWPTQTPRPTRKAVSLVCGVIQNLCPLGSGVTVAKMNLQLRAMRLGVLAVARLSARAHAAASTVLLQTARRSTETLQESGLDQFVALIVTLRRFGRRRIASQLCT